MNSCSFMGQFGLCFDFQCAMMGQFGRLLLCLDFRCAVMGQFGTLLLCRDFQCAMMGQFGRLLLDFQCAMMGQFDRLRVCIDFPMFCLLLSGVCAARHLFSTSLDCAAHLFFSHLLPTDTVSRQAEISVTQACISRCVIYSMSVQPDSSSV